MNQVQKLLASALGIVAFLLFLGFGVGSISVAPDYALVFVDADQNAYIAPPCVPREKWRLLPSMTIGQVHKLKMNPEPKCRDEGGFTQEGRSLSGHFLEKIGVLSPQPSRWNKDGTWKW